jgi:hypothetical protein
MAISGFPSNEMTRDEKPVRLRPIDEDAERAVPVIRLANAETEPKGGNEVPIRLKPMHPPPEVEQRLELPNRDEVELRTYQPGVEVLIETKDYTAETLEQAWEESSAGRHPIPWGWFVLAAAIIASAVIWSLTRVKNAEEKVGQTKIETQSVLAHEEMEELEASRLIDRLDKTIREYFSTTAVEPLIRHVRHPERVGPLMRSYYANRPVFSNNLRALKALQPLTLENRGNFWGANVVLSDGKSKNLIIEILATGEPKIDWETLVCYQPMAWDDFFSQRPKGTSMDFRVMIEADSMYSHEFANSKQWTSFRLTTLDSDETLFGYAPTGGELALTLLVAIRQNGGKQASVILRLSIPQNIQSRRGVVIEQLLSPRWIYLDSPDSGS